MNKKTKITYSVATNMSMLALKLCNKYKREDIVDLTDSLLGYLNADKCRELLIKYK